jgi:hypothetical protein
MAKDVLDILDNPDRQVIVDELLSANLANELEKRVSHTCELGFWQVRKAISRTETIFSNNFVYIRDLLKRRVEDAVKRPAVIIDNAMLVEAQTGHLLPLAVKGPSLHQVRPSMIQIQKLRSGFHLGGKDVSSRVQCMH